MAFKLVKYCLNSYKPTSQLSKIRNIRNISLGSSNLNGNVIEEPPIPEYFIDPDEPLQLKRARLVYQSRKRGMLENGLILGTFASKHLANFTVDQLNVYDRLINLPSNDWDIFYWITLKKPTPPEFESEVLDMLKEHCQNKNKESRYRQPDLY